LTEDGQQLLRAIRQRDVLQRRAAVGRVQDDRAADGEQLTVAAVRQRADQPTAADAGEGEKHADLHGRILYELEGQLRRVEGDDADLQRQRAIAVGEGEGGGGEALESRCST